MRSRRPLVTAILLACATHVVALGAAHLFAPPTLLVAVPPATYEELDVELVEVSHEEPTPAAATPPPAATEPPAAADTPAPAPAADVHRQSTPAAARAASSPPLAHVPAPDATSTGHPESGGTVSRVPTAVFDTDLRVMAGGAAARRFEIPAPQGEAPPASGTSRSGGVVEALDAHDVSVGLGRGGPVLALAEDAARGPEAPVRGSATFDIAVREGGALETRVVDATGDGEAWRKVAATLKHIDPSRLRFAPGAHGWHVVVRIEAKVLLPDGRDPEKLHGFRPALRPSAVANAIAGKADARGSSAAPGGPDHVGGGPSEPPPVGGVLGPRVPSATSVAGGVIQGIIARVLPTPTLEMEGKVCSVALTITPLGVGLGGGCSFENIGAHATRVVSGRIVSEGRL